MPIIGFEILCELRILLFCSHSFLNGKKYIIERDKSITPGNKTDAIRTVGFNNGDYSQHIRADIKRQIQSQRCVILGTSNPEVDHKNGMKNEDRVMRNEDQKLSDFQPLSKAANDAKRQFCKECIRTGIRYDAKNLGYPMSYYKAFILQNIRSLNLLEYPEKDFWVGNEVSCGVGMQRIDILIMQESNDNIHFKIIELKDEQPTANIVDYQLNWYIKFIIIA